jgi:Fe-S cluster biosynthesis and repair protein YggX
MTDIACVRCGQTRAQMAFKPFRNELGQRLFDQICGTCWAEWLQYQQQLINHYALNLQDPQAKQFLYQNLEKYLFTSEPPA